MESVAVTLAVLAMMLMIPLAVWVGNATHAAAERRAEQMHRTTAVLRENTPQRAMMQSGEITMTGTKAQASWRDEHGRWHTGDISARPGLTSGTEVPVWLDQRGNPAGIQPGAAEPGVTGMLTGLAAYLGAGLVTAGLLALLQWRLDRIRNAMWAREWARVGPIWSSQY